MKKPYTPLASFGGHKDVVTGLLWKENGDELTSCAKDSLVIRQSIAHAVLPCEHMRTCGRKRRVVQCGVP